MTHVDAGGSAEGVGSAHRVVRNSRKGLTCGV